MAHFKTAYLQREVVMDVKVSAELHVGDMVTYTASTNTIAKTTNKDSATHIVAQSDMTMNRRDYSKFETQYTDTVAASTSDVKKVALFVIMDKNDVIA